MVRVPRREFFIFITVKDWTSYSNFSWKCVPATLASSQFLECAKHASVPGLLYLYCPMPGRLPPLSAKPTGTPMDFYFQLKNEKEL